MDDLIARLGLLGYLLLPKLIKSVCEAVAWVFYLTEIYCWLDAQISLWGIKQTLRTELLKLETMPHPKDSFTFSQKQAQPTFLHELPTQSEL